MKKCLILVLLITTLFLCFFFQSGSCEPDDHKPEYFLLALTWSPGYCREKACENPTLVKHPSSFKIHGLWPQRRDGKLEAGGVPFNYDLVSRDVKQNLAETWIDVREATKEKNKKFMKTQWEKHGDLSQLTLPDYFQRVADLHFKSRLRSRFREIGVSDGSGLKDLNKLLMDYRNQHLHDIYIVCTRHGENPGTIMEVRLNVSATTYEFQYIVGKQSLNCPNFITWISPWW